MVIILSVKEMTETYDKKAEEDKKKIPFSSHQGFFIDGDSKYYILTQDQQLNLSTNEWESNSILLEHTKDEVKLAIKYDKYELLEFQGCFFLSQSEFETSL